MLEPGCVASAHDLLLGEASRTVLVLELRVVRDGHVFGNRCDVQVVDCFGCIVELEGHRGSTRRLDLALILQAPYHVDPCLVHLGE